MKRKIVEIDEALCDGCGACIPNCAEGALKIIDGKARMISDLFCDGLGACLGHCPKGALRVTEREAEPYDEWRVMDQIVQGGPNVLRAHLDHVEEHGEVKYLATAKEYLSAYGIAEPAQTDGGARQSASYGSAEAGCPGSAEVRSDRRAAAFPAAGEEFSELAQWPVQLHLVNPGASMFRGADILVAADCTAFAAGNFHASYLKGKALVIACPKLDQGGDRYVEKLAALLAEAKTVTVLMMEVPCCSGLLRFIQAALQGSERMPPIKAIVLNLKGEKLSERELI